MQLGLEETISRVDLPQGLYRLWPDPAGLVQLSTSSAFGMTMTKSYNQTCPAKIKIVLVLKGFGMTGMKS